MTKLVYNLKTLSIMTFFLLKQLNPKDKYIVDKVDIDRFLSTKNKKVSSTSAVLHNLSQFRDNFLK